MHCSIHNIEYQVQCSACSPKEQEEFQRSLFEIQEEIEAQRRHLKYLELQRDEMYARQNPGEYACPFCRYNKLKSGATFCPECRAEITQDQWRPIHDFEQAQTKEWAQGELEKQRTAEEAKQLKEFKHGAQKHDLSVYFLQILTLLSSVALYWIWMHSK
jgi:ribosomal protein L37AE/L43A